MSGAALRSNTIPQGSRNFSINLNDTISPIDTLNKLMTKQLSDITTLVESFLTTATHTLTLTDTITLIETLSKYLSRLLSDSIALLENFSLTPNILLTELFSLSDSITRSTTKVLLETITLSDSVVLFYKLLTDTITLTENFTKMIMKLFINFRQGTYFLKQTSGGFIRQTSGGKIILGSGNNSFFMIDTLTHIGTFFRTVIDIFSIKDTITGKLTGEWLKIKKIMSTLWTKIKKPQF